MRIAFFTHTFPALSETFIINQVVGLLEDGHDVTVFALQPPEETTHDIIDEYDLLDRTVYVGNLNTLSSLVRHAPEFLLESDIPLALKNADSVVLAPQRLLAQATFEEHGEFDICHAHFGRSIRIWSFVGDLPDQGPYIGTFYGYDVTKAVHPDNYDCYETVWDQLDLSIGISQHIRSRMLMLGCAESDSTVLRIGVDPELFTYDVTPYETDSDLELLSACRHTGKKGLEYAIRAVADLIGEGHDISYTFAGDGEKTDEYRSLVRKLGITDAVDFPGLVSQKRVSELMREAHLYVQPSVTTPEGDMEGQGLVFQEAQATGTPPIATFHDGIPEGVRHGETGRLVPERDVKALSSAIEFFIDNPDAIERYAEAGREYIEQRFDYRSIADEQVELYERAIEQH